MLTYETGKRTVQYEACEWDNVWIDHADGSDAKRVLYIGDSISCGTRHIATNQTNEAILFDGFGTSKALDNPYFTEALALFAKQEPKRDAVIFNNGLHGAHLDDETEYPRYYEEIIKFLLETFSECPVAVVLTTHVATELEPRVILRNRAAKAIAEKYSLPVIDLYTVSSQAAELLMQDGVHFRQEGYERLAGEVIKGVTQLLAASES